MAHGNPPSLAPVFLLSPLSHPPLCLTTHIDCFSAPNALLILPFIFIFFASTKCEQACSSLEEK